MKVVFRFNHWIPRLLNVNAITLYPYVLYSGSRESANDTIIRHEMVHVRQVRKLGWLRFYASYIAEYFRLRLRGHKHDGAYRQISFEQEAYRDQAHIALTEQERGEIARYLT